MNLTKVSKDCAIVNNEAAWNLFGDTVRLSTDYTHLPRERCSAKQYERRTIDKRCYLKANHLRKSLVETEATTED